MKLGFRFKSGIEIDEGVKKIGRLALPRVIEVAFLQVAKTAELFLPSLITTAAYTYYTFGNTLQLLPVGLFGTSICQSGSTDSFGEIGFKEGFCPNFMENFR